MDKYTKWKKMMDISTGRQRASLVLKGGKVVNVFTEKIENVDISIEDGVIAGLGDYDGIENIDVSGKWLCPGFIDGHIHLESSMVSPKEFEKAVLPHGTTTVVTDPHEIGNVAGLQGIDYMLKATESLLLDVFFMMPSCVPATELDESGAALGAEELKPYYDDPRVLGLAEVMNARGVTVGLEGLLRKTQDALNAGKAVDGHAPFLEGKELCAYVCAGVLSDHECSDYHEALKKLARGQWIMIREGTAARNLEALMPLFEAPFYQRCMLVTDDRHPGDLISMGHIDHILRRAVSMGADPVRAIRMATLHAAQYFGLKDRGALAPGRKADIAVLEDLKEFKVAALYKNGIRAASDGQAKQQREAGNVDPSWEEAFPKVFQSFHMDEITEEDIRLEREGYTQRIIQLNPGELLTKERFEPWEDDRKPKELKAGTPAPGVSLERDIVKAAVFERHRHTGHVGLGFIGGYGLKKGAVATSVAHDSHNLITVGTNDRDMVLAANAVRACGGGLAIAADGEITGLLPLPIGGIMTNASAEETEERLKTLKEEAARLGVSPDIDAFMTLAFVSLPVIPKLRLTTHGIIDTDKQETVPATF